MKDADLNLLVALEVLLETQSVAESARRLGLSPSAMSRTLSRLRDATGDPLLVRSGRKLVPTPRAEDIKERIHPVVRDARQLLQPKGQVNLQTLKRIFVLRTGDGFVENFGPQINERVRQAAPKVVLQFLQKPDHRTQLNETSGIDLETGVISDETPPDLVSQALFRDRFICAVRKGHPLTEGRLTAQRFAQCDHVDVVQHTPSAGNSGPIDRRLHLQGLERNVVMIVGSFATAIAMARQTDLVASVPDKPTSSLRSGLVELELPFAPIEVTVSMLWHPRMDADPAHRWLRNEVRSVCAD